MELRKIASFTVDHEKIGKGVYLSRVDGDVTTWDVRMKLPNAEPPLSTGAIHTIEHLFATWARSSPLSDAVIYVGPMGCRTGFYLLTRGLSASEAIGLVRDSFSFVASFEEEVPGASAKECGNWKDHDLAGARAEAAAFLPALARWTAADTTYPS